MTVNSQKLPPQSTGTLKYLFMEPEDQQNPQKEYFPYFYVEARVDFNDVRTGLRETVSLSKALEIYSSDAELLWVKDMIHDIDIQKTRTSLPDSVRLCSLPVFVDANYISRMETKFIQYLLRSFVARVYRNYALNIYSLAGENRDDFVRRCLELLDGPERRELDLLHDVFKRRLEQTKEKFLQIEEPLGLELAKMESQNKSLFFHYSERIDEHFLRGKIAPDTILKAVRYSSEMPELEERLRSLELEACQEIKKLQDSYLEKAQALDEYLLHPNPKDIHFVRSGVLWMPKKAA